MNCLLALAFLGNLARLLSVSFVYLFLAHAQLLSIYNHDPIVYIPDLKIVVYFKENPPPGEWSEHCVKDIADIGRIADIAEAPILLLTRISYMPLSHARSEF